MKRFFALFFLYTSLLFLPAHADDIFLRIVQPYENQNFPNVSQSFVFGSVLPATASLTINGTAVVPHTNGGFLTMIPFKEGAFTIEAIANDGVSVASTTRRVNVASGSQTYSATYSKIDPLSPRTRVVLRPNDVLEVSMQAAPEGSAQFKFSSKSEWFPMEEQPSRVKGMYKGIYTIRPGDDFDKTDLVFSLRRKDGKKITTKAGADITIQRRKTPRLIELREDAVLLTGPDPDLGYNYFCLQGTRLEVTGEWGDFLRVAVGISNSGWVRKSITTELPSGALPAKSVSYNIRISTTPFSTLIELPLQFRHAHRVEQFVHPHSMKVTLYGVTADTDRIRYKSQESVVKEIQWFQPEPGTYVLDIQTNQDHPWGYDIRYENTTLVIEIRHQPPLPKKLKKGYDLRGLKIAVDAGHSPLSFGTIGPWGNTEASVALMGAQAIKKELEKWGAQVVMTQDGTKELSLQDRVNFAWKERAHLFLSLHLDACPEGQNPRDVEGYSVHYFHPQSHDFAEAVHKVYGAKTKIRDQGVWRSNLAVCRMTQMPSILLEQGFLMIPEYEELFISSSHQQILAEAVVESFFSFLKKDETP